MKKLLLSALCLTLSLSALFFASGCGNAKPERHTHSFTKEVVTDEYKASDATCDKKAEYYYSCECGEKGEETFAYGSPLGHEFTDYVSDNNATYEKDGTKTAHCNRNGCTATDTIPDENSKLESKMTFKTLTVGEKNTDGNVSVYGKVPNAQKTYSFIDEIKTEGAARFVVSTDVYGIHTVVTKTIPLSEGDNKIFVIELNGEDVKSIYEITIRRRPMYSVVFDTDGGTKLDSQQIEEDFLAIQPTSPTKSGYAFNRWDYDFTQPITRNTTIKATWSANTNTPYKVEYYKENLEDDNYTLCETSDLQGVSGAIASAEQKTYEHFIFNENKSVPSGAIAGDGSLILKMYYKRNVYAISNANSAYGEITNAATIKYGATITATEYLGCEFIGWFNGETLLSSAKRYEFTAECDVYAKFKAKDEMSGFNFKSSTTTCEITALKDKTATSVVIPDCVTSIGGKAFYNCNKLTSVTIPDSVTSIGYYAFYNCGGIKNIYITNLLAWCKIAGLNNIMDCDSFKNFYLNNELLTSLVIPNNITSISNYTFKNCSSLVSITIPDGVTSIGNFAFSGCRNLTSITIPANLTYIGNDAFESCNELMNIYISDLAAWCKVSRITNLMNAGSIKNLYLNNKLITILEIPNNITSIENGTFYNCGRLNSVIISESVISINNGAFAKCSGITSVTIGNSVTYIGSSVFADCYGLTNITIGNGVTYIGYSTFKGCRGLTSITFNGTKEQWRAIILERDWNDGVPANVVHCTDGDISIK